MADVVELSDEREVVQRNRVVTSKEENILTVGGGWSGLTVYFDGIRGRTSAVGVVVRVYAIAAGVRALVATFTAASYLVSYAWNVPTFGCERYEVTAQTASGVTTDEIAIGAVGYGREPGATVSEVSGVAGVGTISATDVVWNPGGDTTFPIVSRARKVTTADATQTTLASYTIGTNRAVRLTVTVTGFRVSNGESYGKDMAVTYKRVAAGAPAIVGALLESGEGKDIAGWASTIDVSGNDVRVRVTGAAASTVDWSCELRAQEIV
jgi:hypothetical protein